MKHFSVFLIWVRSLRGPSPIRVCANAEDEPDIGARLKHDVLATHRLHPHEELMSFPQLEAIYPPPKEACQ